MPSVHLWSLVAAARRHPFTIRLLVGGVVGLLSCVLATPTPAAACRIGPPTVANTGAWAATVLVGTVVATTPEVATVHVEEVWRGTGITTTVTIENRVRGYAPVTCASGWGEGDHVTIGNRFVAFLSPNYDGAATWQFGGGFSAGFIVLDDTDHDQRFGAPTTPDTATTDQERSWFYHTNLGYPESSTAAAIKQEWQATDSLYHLITAVQRLAVQVLQR